MSKFLRNAIIVSCVGIVFFLIYGELKYRRALCPEGTIKVRLYDGGVGCFVGQAAQY